jgi:hypothetical protein
MISIAALVHEVTEKAKDILATVVVDMPLFTLHNERHSLNVIGWMEDLLGPEGIQILSPLECALCILAAYVHDLGMTLDKAESNSLANDSDYMRFRDLHLEECHLINTLIKSGQQYPLIKLKQQYRANVLESHLRTEYLRVTHSDSVGTRLRTRLQSIAPKLTYRGVDFRRQLELVSISHNQPTEWLRLQFEREGLRWDDTIGNGERVNFCLPGLLLRLADIMDFDASRTPAILFQHIGLDNMLASRFEDISSQEWNKHLAITGITSLGNGDTLTYRAGDCPHPAVEKSIRTFVGMIQAEVQQVALEIRNWGEHQHCRIRLPRNVRADVTPMRNASGCSVYTYHDWNFTLDQAEVMQLLMGENLYGDPTVCVRELLQNALDSIELRDLRLQLAAKDGAHPFEEVDGYWLKQKSGWLICDGREQELAVQLKWGEDNGQQFICVEDNGTGMTENVIEHYFTRIGKSFYRSPKFRAEQVELRRHGLIATPISTFGIGILSCFMIADRIQVRTRPGQKSESRPALDIQVYGPGSLFWTSPGTLEHQGTEVTIWLRQDSQRNPLHLNHSKQECFQKLREFFGYVKNDDVKNNGDRIDVLDPGLIAAQHVVWPKYPIHVIPPGKKEWTIDASLHIKHLATINNTSYRNRLIKWNLSADSLDKPQWKTIDWTDDGEGICDDATGTRIRLWFPEIKGAGQSIPDWELEALIEDGALQLTPRILCKGMYIADTKRIDDIVPLKLGLGWRAWIDLCGVVSPRLTVDRNTAQIPEDPGYWNRLLEGVWNRFLEHLRNSNLAFKVLANNWKNTLAMSLHAALPYGPSEGWLPKGSAAQWEFPMIAFLASVARENNTRCSIESVRNRAYGLTIDFPNNFESVVEHELDGPGRKIRVVNLAIARAIALARDIFRNKIGFEYALTKHCDIVRSYDYSFKDFADVEILETNLLQESFFLDLSCSWPALGLQALDGKIGDATLTAPAGFHFELNGRQVIFADHSGENPLELAQYGYDLCFPMTTIPLGRLRQKCPEWREDRRYRPLAILPFLSPTVVAWIYDQLDDYTKLLPVKELFAFRPATELWYKPFSQWSQSDWKNPGHYSLLWDIGSGAVLAAQGAQNRKAMRKVGISFHNFVKLNDLIPGTRTDC